MSAGSKTSIADIQAGGSAKSGEADQKSEEEIQKGFIDQAAKLFPAVGLLLPSPTHSLF